MRPRVFRDNKWQTQQQYSDSVNVTGTGKGSVWGRGERLEIVMIYKVDVITYYSN